MSYFLVDRSVIRVAITDLSITYVLVKFLISARNFLTLVVLGMEGLTLSAMLNFKKLNISRFDLSHASHKSFSASVLESVGSVGLFSITRAVSIPAMPA